MLTPNGVMDHPASGMLKKLEKYYMEQHISAIGFNCDNLSSCSAGCKEGDFITAREAFVGSEYEKGTLPRLLFISLDASDDFPGPQPERRTLDAVRNEEPQPCNPDPIRARHWYETHKLAHQILESIATNLLGHSIPLDQICRYFAHTNSAKCKDKSMGKRQGRPILFQKCRQFIKGEVTILCPDIIVTQGLWARESIRNGFPILRQEHIPDHPKYGYKIIDILGHEVIEFETVHPTARGHLFQPEKKIAYPWYTQEALKFVRRSNI